MYIPRLTAGPEPRTEVTGVMDAPGRAALAGKNSLVAVVGNMIHNSLVINDNYYYPLSIMVIKPIGFHVVTRKLFEEIHFFSCDCKCQLVCIAGIYTSWA